MLNQISLDLFDYIAYYLPNILGIILYAVLLVFATLIYKRNSYNYGITIMISSIISIASDIIYLSIQFPLMPYRLLVEQGLPIDVATLIIYSWNFVFLSLYITSTIFLVVSIYLIYKTHQKDRID